MGITTDKFFENIYNVIFAPKEFFNREQNIISLRLAIGTIVFVASVSKAASAIFSGSISSVFLFIFTLVLNLFTILFLWFLTALFFEYIAKIFDRSGNLRKLLYYTAFATVPYIFFAPLNLLKNIGTFGYILGSGLEFLLYLWIIFLYVLVLSAVYKITLSRSFMMISLPFIAFFFSVYWTICFFSKIWYIFSI